MTLALTWWQWAVAWTPNAALAAWQVWELRRYRQARQRFTDAAKARGWRLVETALNEGGGDA